MGTTPRGIPYPEPTDPVAAGAAAIRAVAEAVPGTVAYAQVITVLTGYGSSIADVFGVTVTWNAVAGRRYKITGAVRAGSTGDGVGHGRLFVNNNGVYVSLGDAGFRDPNIAYAMSLTAVWKAAATASVVTKLQFQRTQGVNNLTLYGDSTSPLYVLVEDIGI